MLRVPACWTGSQFLLNTFFLDGAMGAVSAAYLLLGQVPAPCWTDPRSAEDPGSCNTTCCSLALLQVPSLVLAARAVSAEHLLPGRVPSPYGGALGHPSGNCLKLLLSPISWLPARWQPSIIRQHTGKQLASWLPVALGMASDNHTLPPKST